MNTTDDILEEVKAMVADILMVNSAEVQPSDSFLFKLDGDSLGFLELAFKCEKRYGVKLHFQKAIPEEKLITDQSGVLTPDALGLLKRELPFLDYGLIEANPLKNRLAELLTVEAIAEFVRRAIAEKEAAKGPREELSVQPA